MTVISKCTNITTNKYTKRDNSNGLYMQSTNFEMGGGWRVRKRGLRKVIIGNCGTSAAN